MMMIKSSRFHMPLDPIVIEVITPDGEFKVVPLSQTRQYRRDRRPFGITLAPAAGLTM
jgi:hypothetical protein